MRGHNKLFQYLKDRRRRQINRREAVKCSRITPHFINAESNQEGFYELKLRCVRLSVCTSSSSKKPQCFQLCADIVEQFEPNKKEGTRMCKDDVLAHMQANAHTRTHTYTLLADTSSLCYFHLLLWAMMLQKKEKKKEYRQEQMMAEGEMRRRDGHDSQCKQHLEKWTDRSEKTERKRDGSRRKTARQKAHK